MYSPEVIATIQGILDKNVEGGTFVMGWAELTAELRKHNLCWRSRIPPDFCGISRMNRGSQGVIAAEAQKHGEDMITVGYTESRARDCVAFESSDYPLDRRLIKIKLRSRAASFHR